MNVINLGYCHTSHLCPRTTVRMECPDAVLVLLCQVAANLDGNRRIDHADQRGRESDVPRDRLSLSHNETMQKHNSVSKKHAAVALIVPDVENTHRGDARAVGFNYHVL